MARRAKKLKVKIQLDSDTEAWLRGQPHSAFFQGSEELWLEYGEDIVAEHVAEFPGTRPALFWRYDAKEPCQRLGGVGTPDFESLCITPTFSFGLPTSFIDASDVEYYGPSFKGVAIDPDDPPKYESQATYLDRHALFLPGEKKRLKKADWEADEIEYA